MKIVKVECVSQIVFKVKVDDIYQPYYRRYADGAWEVLEDDDNWVKVYRRKDKLEKLFKDAQEKHPTLFFRL